MRLLMLLLWLPFGIGFAADEERQVELHDIQERIAEVSRHMKDIRSQQGELQGQLADTEKAYGASLFALKNLTSQAVKKRREVSQLQSKITLQKQDISRRSKGLAGMMRSAYALGQEDRLKMLLNQQDPALSSRMLVYYRYMNRSRLRKLQEIAASLQALQTLEQEMRGQSEHLNGLLELQEFEQAKLNGIQKERKALLDKLEADYVEDQQQLARLQANEQQMQILLGSLQEVADDFPVAQEIANQPFTQLRGRLAWPVRGQLLKNFGSQRGEGTWDGVLIAASEGTEIRAVSSGRVIFADWLNGYGLLIIVDHGEGYMTLYAFNQSLYKKVGDTVEMGEVIAAVGQSSGRDEAGLYFGIRKDGKAVDPVVWCKQ